MTEAVGGILRLWRAEALAARPHLVGPHLAQGQFGEARDCLGSLVQCCGWWARLAWRPELPRTAQKDMRTGDALRLPLAQRWLNSSTLPCYEGNTIVNAS